MPDSITNALDPITTEYFGAGPLHAAALDYSAKLPVFPCNADKTPACERGYLAATTDRTKISEWWSEAEYNIGVPTGAASGWIVLDVDPGGQEALKALEAEHGDLPETRVVQTPRGGFHVYLQYDPAKPIRNSQSKLGPHIDVRGDGGYVLAPPSVGQNGQQYAVLLDHAVAPCPSWIYELLAAKETPPREALASVELDRNIAVETFRSRIKTDIAQNGPPLDGHGSDDRTYRIIGIGRDLGLSDEKIGDALQDLWASHFDRTWIDTKIANAAKYAQNEIGCDAPRTAEETFGAAIEKLGLNKPANDDAPTIVEQPKPTPYSEVLARVVPPVRELIPGLLEKGVPTFLSAPGGSHKSRLLQQWGLCLDAGAKIWDRTVERAKFVCLSYEDHGNEIARRAQTIARRFNLPTNSAAELWDLAGSDLPIAVATEAGKVTLTDFGRQMHEHLRSIAGHKFVGIDSCYNALRFEGKAKINEGSVMAAIGLLQRLCIECDCTILVLWHPSQSGQERGDASGWSVAWHNAPRARLSLTAVKDTDDAFDLKVEKRNHGPKGKPITLYFSAGVLVPHTEIDTAQMTGRLLDACVQVATDAAAKNTPIQRQRRCEQWQIEKVAAVVGYAPTDRIIKEQLAHAITQGRLEYRLQAPRRHPAGYFPTATLADVSSTPGGEGGTA
ncbi:MAG: bifunctional DNA primase/polymerase [Planctomycetes bacterium]|jgi:hypothetical protein|nr:bifunctional DNA primase/polymerase [Planctomycetota bacterium]